MRGYFADSLMKECWREESTSDDPVCLLDVDRRLTAACIGETRLCPIAFARHCRSGREREEMVARWGPI